MSLEVSAMIALLCALLVGCLVFSRRKKIEENWRRRYIRKAKRQKAFAEAYMIKREELPDGGREVTYEYQVGRSKYRKKIKYGQNEEYSNKLIVYYKPKSPAYGVCEEIKESSGTVLNVMGWSFLTYMLVFLGLEVSFGTDGLLENDAYGEVYGEWKLLFSRPEVLAVGVLAICLYALEIYLISKRREVWDRRKEEAIAAGRTVLGTSIKYWRESKDDTNDRYYHATYVYEVNGRQYKKSIVSKTDLPHMMWFYYEKTPDKAFCDYDNKDLFLNLLVPLFLVLPVAAAYLFAKVFGISADY